MTAITASHLLRVELAVLVTLAVLLLAAPAVTTRVLGLPMVGSNFWPRLVGALCLGLAVAVIATDQGWLTISTAKGPLATGIGLGAFVAINLTTAFVLVTMLIFGTSMPTRRGRILTWVFALATAAMGLVEIAYVM